MGKITDKLDIQYAFNVGKSRFFPGDMLKGSSKTIEIWLRKSAPLIHPTLDISQSPPLVHQSLANKAGSFPRF